MKNVLTVVLAIVLVAAIALGVLYFTTDITPVNAIVEDPSGYKDSEVMLLGTVGSRFVYQDEVFFELDDGTGSIAVHITGDAPALGTRVVAKGVVRSLITIGNHDFGVLLEANEVRAPRFWEEWAAPGAPQTTTTITTTTTTTATSGE